MSKSNDTSGDAGGDMSGDTSPPGAPAAKLLAAALEDILGHADEPVRNMVRDGFHGLSRYLSQQAHDGEPRGFLLADTRLKALRDAVETVVSFGSSADAAGTAAGQGVGKAAGHGAGQGVGETAREAPAVGDLGSTPAPTEQRPEAPPVAGLPVEDVTPADLSDELDPADASDSADAPDPADASDSVDPSDPSDPSDAADPLDPLDPLDPSDAPDPDERSTPAAPATTTGPAPASPDELLRQCLAGEFTELTAAGSPAWKALVQPELVYVPEPAFVAPPKLGDLWRTLHLFALRLRWEEADRLRTRWRALAAEHLGEVDGEGLVPGLPGFVGALPLRDPRSLMAPDAVREHAAALLGRAEAEHTEPSEELRYVLALMEAYARENNQLMAQNDSGLVAALEILTGSGPVLSDDAAMKSYRQLVTERLAELARCVGAGSRVEPALIKADEVLVALVHDPLARPGSWWHQRRHELQRKLVAHLVSCGTEVQADAQLGYGKSNNRTRSDIVSKERRGVDILWWLRLPYRLKDGNWEKGRMIHEKYRA
jgi:hypothetical protein